MARGCRKVVLMLSDPSDEVGNSLLPLDKLDASDVNPYSDVLSLEQYREKFGVNKHEFTGVDDVDYYTDLIREEGAVPATCAVLSVSVTVYSPTGTSSS